MDVIKVDWKEAEYGSHVEVFGEKKVDIDETTPFLDHVFLGCTQRECKPNETIIEQYAKTFESRISAWATEKLLEWERLHAKNSSVVLRHGSAYQKCVERYCELANQKVEQLYKVSNPCLNDHQFLQEELESVEELSEVCSHIVLCLYLARMGRPDILWSVNKLAQTLIKADFLHSSHMWISDNIVMWRCLVFYWEKEHLFLSVGCARTRLLSRPVVQSLKSFFWVLDCVWMGYLLST